MLALFQGNRSFSNTLEFFGLGNDFSFQGFIIAEVLRILRDSLHNFIALFYGVPTYLRFRNYRSNSLYRYKLRNYRRVHLSVTIFNLSRVSQDIFWINMFFQFFLFIKWSYLYFSERLRMF